MKRCFYLFLCMAVRQCCGKRRRDLEFGVMDNLTGLLGIRGMDSILNVDKEVVWSDEGDK